MGVSASNVTPFFSTDEKTLLQLAIGTHRSGLIKAEQWETAVLQVKKVAAGAISQADFFVDRSNFSNPDPTTDGDWILGTGALDMLAIVNGALEVDVQEMPFFLRVRAIIDGGTFDVIGLAGGKGKT